VLLGLAAACGGERPVEEVAPAAAETPTLAVHSAIDESVLAPLLAEFVATSGVEVEVRYGGADELAREVVEAWGGRWAPAGDPPATVGEAPAAGASGGPRAAPPAARGLVFLASDGAALGAVAAAGAAAPLPASLLSGLDPLFADPEGRWAGLTGRARSVVYDPRRSPREEAPADLAAFGDERYRGRIALAPDSRSFRVHLAAYRALHGPEVARRLLERLAANEPRLYAGGGEVVAAVLDGEADFGLADHCDLWRVRARRGVDAGANLALPAADASGFLDLSGAAVIGDTPAARQLVAFLLAPASQHRLVGETFEYPLARAAAPAAPQPPLADLDVAQVDYRAVAAALPGIAELVAQAGLVR
jgi:iron(III) transport system substrate-binding protein